MHAVKECYLRHAFLCAVKEFSFWSFTLSLILSLPTPTGVTRLLLLHINGRGFYWPPQALSLQIWVSLFGVSFRSGDEHRRFGIPILFLSFDIIRIWVCDYSVSMPSKPIPSLTENFRN